MTGFLRTAAAAAAVAMAFAAAPAAAESAVGLTTDLESITADGTWDCKDIAGAPLGAVVVVEKAYAFIKLDGKVGGYGKLHRVFEEQFDLPVYVVLDGYLKDAVHVSGVSLSGPVANPHDYSGQIFLKLVVATHNEPFCVRREASGS